MVPKWIPNHVKIASTNDAQIDTEQGETIMQKWNENHHQIGS